MATKINAADHLIVIDKTFVSGKDRVTIDHQVVFEGKWAYDAPKEFVAGKHRIILQSKLVNKFTGATMFDVEVAEQGKSVFSGKFDLMGQSVSGHKEAGQNQVELICGTIGCAIGAIPIGGLLTSAGVLPQGLIRNALAGGIGGALGWAAGYGLVKLVGRRLSVRLIVALFSAVHVFIGLIFSYIALRYLLVRPCIDLVTLMTVASFVLAWGIVARRSWAIWLQAVVVALLVPIYISGAGAVEFGSQLPTPWEFDVSVLVFFTGRKGFYAAFTTLAIVECVSLIALVALQIMPLSRTGLESKFTPQTPSSVKMEPGQIHSQVRKLSLIAKWEFIALIPLAFAILIGDFLVPSSVNAMLKGYLARQREVEFKEKGQASADFEKEKILTGQLEVIQNQINSAQGNKKRYLKSENIGDFKSNPALRTQRIAEMDQAIKRLTAEKAKCQKDLDELRQRKAKRPEENRRYILTGQK